MKTQFGITPEQYNALLKNQNGVCAICGKKETRRLNKKVVKLAVDHSHKTGRVRELLCASCNAGIGMFKHDLVIVEKAVAYLRYHEGENNGTGS